MPQGICVLKPTPEKRDFEGPPFIISLIIPLFAEFSNPPSLTSCGERHMTLGMKVT
jgi:hypothetical protein